MEKNEFYRWFGEFACLNFQHKFASTVAELMTESKSNENNSTGNVSLTK